MKTTAIGSFPKPDYLNLNDWFKTTTAKQDKVETNFQVDDDTLVSQAIHKVICIQKDIGIDVVTDGEVRRENYIHGFCRSITGIDFKNRQEKVLRNGAYACKCPTIVSELVSNCENSHCKTEWLFSNKIAKQYNKTLKYTLPGPLTISDTLTDKHYGNQQELCRALAKIIRQEVLQLYKAGCREIQIDEPVFARYPAIALDWGISLLDEIVADLPDAFITVHMCCGYPSHLDQTDYLKANYETMKDVVLRLDKSNVDAISIEDAHCHHDLSYLKDVTQKTIVLGVVAIAKSRVETVDEICARISHALQFIPKERLIIAPDCGLGFLPESILIDKLLSMMTAVHKIRL